MFVFILSDVDECVEETDNCSPHADCEDTDGGFICRCHSGFTGDGKSCRGNGYTVATQFDLVEFKFSN